MCSLRSNDGLHGDLGVGVAAPLPDLLGVHRTPGVLDPPELALQGGARDHGGVGEVHVEHHLAGLAGRTPRGHARVDRGGVGLLAVAVLRCVCLGVEVEGELAAGEVPDGGGPPHVEGVGGAEVLECLGAGGDGGVEVEGVGQVQLCLLYTSPSPRDLSTSRMPSSA